MTGRIKGWGSPERYKTGLNPKLSKRGDFEKIDREEEQFRWGNCLTNYTEETILLATRASLCLRESGIML